MDRLKVLSNHVNPRSQWSVATRDVAGRESPSFINSPDDIVVVAAKRTPIGKAKRGSFKDTHGDDLLSAAFNGVLECVNLKPDELGDICIGNVNDPRSAFTARAAQFFSGIPETVPASSVNRQCGSGLQAFMNIAGGIKNKAYDIGMAGGLEMMSSSGMGSKQKFANLNPRVMDVKNAKDSLIPMGLEMMSASGMGSASQFDNLNPRIMEVKLAMDSLTPMGITSENVAERFGITREQQDRFSMESHQKAAKATEGGLFTNEIIPVVTKIKDKDGNERTIKVTKDDGIRGDTTMEILGRLKPAFKPDGSTTAGNSSQVSDGAAAVILASRREAEKRGLAILGTLRGFAVKGCPPDIMGIGPAVAIPEVLKMTGLSNDDIDIFEINEAFASQAFYCQQKLGIPAEKVNPKGGAIAFGHPLGCTGARMIGTLLHEMKRRGKRSFGVVSMCMGTGMGAAAVFEYNP